MKIYTYFRILFFIIVLLVIVLIVMIKKLVSLKRKTKNGLVSANEACKKQIKYVTIMSICCVVIIPSIFLFNAYPDMEFGRYDGICTPLYRYPWYYEDSVIYFRGSEELLNNPTGKNVKAIFTRFKATMKTYCDEPDKIPILVVDNSSKDGSEPVVIVPVTYVKVKDNYKVNYGTYINAIDEVAKTIEEGHEYKITISYSDEGKRKGYLDMVTIQY